jgi:ABC-type cobalamin/Fe3+-siderophores transport system ATPase subunit
MLEARNLTVRYEKSIAVSDVSLKLLPGEITAVIGPNGAGKSTLLRTLNGGLTPYSGQVILDGVPISKYPRTIVARNIAVVAQEAELRFPVTVLEFVLGGRYASVSSRTWGWETEEDLHAARRVLREAELEGMSERLMNELSGGERQRAVLARALATEAKHLLLDEPTANLDLAHQAAIFTLVKQRCESDRVAAIVVTHDVNLAAEFANHILLLKQGETLSYGLPEEVLTAELLEPAFGVRVLVDQHPISAAPRITPVHQLERGRDA